MNESDYVIVRPGGNREVMTAKEIPPVRPSRIRKDQMSTSMRRVIAKSLGLGLLAALSLAMSITSFAQSDNTQISGFVKDQAGGVISGAKVTLKSETKSLERSAITNSEGYFVITTLPPDFYSITVEAV